MRKLPKHYLDLYSGLSRIRELNQHFQAEWKPKITHWNRMANFEYYQRMAQTNRAREAWGTVQKEGKPKKVAGGGYLILGVLSACPGLFLLASVGSGSPTEKIAIFLISALTFLLGIGFGVLGVWLILRAAAAEQRVINEFRQDPFLQIDPSRPTPPIPRPALPIIIPDLVELWWQQLEAEAGVEARLEEENNLRLPSPKYGIRGERLLMGELKKVLPNHYFAAAGLLVTCKLDVDVVLFGPNGVWNLESKYYAGEITFANGEWRHTNQRIEENDQQAEKEFNNLHQQYLREQDVLERPLRAALPGWPVKVKGGLVFTHPRAALDICPDCPVIWGKTETWIQTIRGAKPEPFMTEENLLKAADVLLTISQSNQKQPYGSSIWLAETLYQQQVAKMQELDASIK